MLRYINTFFLSLSLFLSIFSAQASVEELFNDLKNGKSENLEKYFNQEGISLNVRNKEGYTPLHWLIKHYVDYDLERYINDKALHAKNIEESDNYIECLMFLLEKGADIEEKTPEGWNALQFAVVNGKYSAVSRLLSRTSNRAILDREGNTLLHLSTLADRENTISKFWYYLQGSLLSDKVNIQVPNFAGQTPIAYYFSTPRMKTRNSMNLISILSSAKSLTARDLSGKNALDYARLYNPWAVPWLESFMQTASRIERESEEFLRQFERQAQENLKKAREYEQSTGQRTLNESFSETYYYQCNINYKGELTGSKLEEPVYISVTPTHVYISFLEPIYGPFKVESSGIEIINGSEWYFYKFVQNSNNSTYKGILFPKSLNRSRVILSTSSGNEGYCAN